MTSETRKASNRRAVALGFDGVNAPTVSAKGLHLAADEIVKIARRHGVPVIEKADLARVLDEVNIDEEIPADLYEAVATIINELDSKKP